MTSAICTRKLVNSICSIIFPFSMVIINILNIFHLRLKKERRLSIKKSCDQFNVIYYLLVWWNTDASDWSKNLFFHTCIINIFAESTFLKLFWLNTIYRICKNKPCQQNVKLCLFNCQHTQYIIINIKNENLTLKMNNTTCWIY